MGGDRRSFNRSVRGRFDRDDCVPEVREVARKDAVEVC